MGCRHCTGSRGWIDEHSDGFGVVSLSLYSTVLTEEEMKVEEKRSEL